MVDLGDEMVVRVDDIDEQGKVSLSPVGPTGGDGSTGDGSGSSEPAGGPPAERQPSDTVSFEDAWEREAAQEFGDLGLPTATGPGRRPERDRGPRRNPRRGGRR